MSEHNCTVYVVKLWQTNGIERMPGHLKDDGKYVRVQRPACFPQHLELGKEAFLRRDDAVAEAEQLRTEKVAKLARQIANIAAIDFTGGQP